MKFLLLKLLELSLQAGILTLAILLVRLVLKSFLQSIFVFCGQLWQQD